MGHPSPQRTSINCTLCATLTFAWISALGTDLTLMRFGPVYERRGCARPTPGPRSTSMDWRSSTTPRSRCFWTSSFLFDPSHTVGVRRTPGSTMSATRLNARLGNSSVPFIGPRRVTWLLLPLCDLHSVENMQCFVGGNVKLSGGTQSTSKARIHVNCGDPSML